ncbi:hypothetical protein [Tardiphaga sp.]|nr:hypothetical protein [Tardiphaga sp.]
MDKHGGWDNFHPDATTMSFNSADLFACVIALGALGFCINAVMAEPRSG